MKNHKEISEIVSGIMPENPDDCMCPVRSFKKYIQHLNPENEFLWQKPLENINRLNPEVWYSKQHLGKNTLGKFMTEASQKCELSKIYKNHSIRVTGITVLIRMKFSPSEIMSVSGHKSVQSLSNYQHTQPKQKVQMGQVLYQSMTRTENEIHIPNKRQLPQNNRPALENITNSTVMATSKKSFKPENALVSFHEEEDDIPDFDLVSILNDLESHDKEKEGNAVAVMTTRTNVLNNISKSMFSNCTIQNITFNIGK